MKRRNYETDEEPRLVPRLLEAEDAVQDSQESHQLHQVEQG